MTETDKLSDFKDWISPIIVKELRQGMRTRLFTAAFIVLQGFMVLFVMIGFAEGGGSNAGTSGFFWFLISITLLLVMPLRGFAALSSEIRLNTMDLIALTRMSSWRIATGKWAALVSQTILIAVGVLPYVVLRYFFGGVNPINELFFLGVILIVSCVLSAAMVGLSAFPSFLVRALIAIGASIAAISMSAGLGGVTTETIEFDNPQFRWAIFAFLLGAAFLTYYFLAMGATRIATEADNYSTLKRLVSLLIVGITLCLPLIPSIDPSPCYVIAGILITFLALDALTETPSGVRSLHLPFNQKGLIGYAMQFLLTPGWFSGVFYILCLGLMHTIAGMNYGPPEFTWNVDQAVTVGVAFTGTLLFPLLIIHLFFTEPRNLFATYFFVQSAVAAIGFCLLAMQDSFPALMWAGSPIPFVNFLMAIEDQNNTYDSMLLVLALITLIVTVLVCIWRGNPLIRQINMFRGDYLAKTRPSPSGNSDE
ncbi:MAG: hypothetical protein AAGH89_14625 [Verrucomicrobiota bacterium]